MAQIGYIEQVRPGVLSWLESIRWPNEGWGRWKYNAHMVRNYGLISSSMAIHVLDLLGVLPQLDDRQRHEAVSFLQSTQNPTTGYFIDPLVGESDRVPNAMHSWEDIWGQMSAAGPALALLGAQPLYGLPQASFADLRSVDVADWVRSLGWENPWHVGERFHRAINAYVRSLGELPDSERDPVLATAFATYETEVHDPRSGTPRRRGCNDPSVAMAGLFKVMMAYHSVNRPVPNAREAIDSTLALQHADGEFGFRNNMCINWDALWVLRELDREIGGAYRHSAIVRAGNLAAQHLLARYRKPDGGFAFCGDHCWEVHHSIYISPPLPEGDMVGTIMSLRCLHYADEWNGMG
jgi:hypothetical protein